MNDMLNRLRAWAAMYDEMGMKPASMGTMNGSQVYAPGAHEAARNEWVQQMLGRESQQAPDYFNFEEERAPAAQDRSVAPVRDVNALRAALSAAPMGGQQQPLQRNRLLAYRGGL